MPSEHQRREPAPPSTLVGGRYRITEVLGAGGMATVYRVVDGESQAVLALKRLHAHANAHLTALFEREFRTLAGLQHPRIVQVFDYGVDGSAYYTMELLSGSELKDQAPVSWRDACSYLRDAAEALQVLHQRRLIHRDVSPRNLWRTPDGRVKLIDFGALVPFGRVDSVVGTPPFLSPEALHSEPLDQRVDLYALGATAYYLLTGLHAFPARHLSDLPALWTLPPEPPSQLVERLGRSDLESLPPELDRLIGALLTPDPRARLTDASELLDRLQAFTQPRVAANVDTNVAQLANAAFVGRTRELRTIRRRLATSAQARGASLIVGGEGGAGRSRLLREAATMARVSGALALHVDAAGDTREYGAASALAERLLDALPALARQAAEPHAALLAHVSLQLRARLHAEPAAVEGAAAELRVRVQAALRDWFLAVCEQQTLVILVDGLEHCDEGSGAFLLALAQQARTARLLLILAQLQERTRSERPFERALLRVSRGLRLPSLSLREVNDLLASVFARVEFLDRLADRLTHAAHGNPGHLLELCAQLVRQDLITLSEGRWMLPATIPEQLLSTTREQALYARLDRLPASARELGRVLSSYGAVVPRALAERLATPELLRQLPGLLEEDVVVSDHAQLRFAQEPLRERLYSELPVEQRRGLQRTVAEYLLEHAQGSNPERLRAGAFLLASGDARGGDIAVQAAMAIVHREGELARPLLPLIEQTLHTLEEQGRPLRERLALLALLASAGFYIDRSYALRYGARAIAAFESTLGITLADKLERWLGRKAGFLVALVWAALGFRVRFANPRVPRFAEAMLMFLSSVTALCGSNSVCLDAETAERQAESLRRFELLGPNHVTAFVYRYVRAIARTVRDGFAETARVWQPVIAQLQASQVRGLPEGSRKRYIAGALLARGIGECFRDDQTALQTAGELDAAGLAVGRMAADQLRMIWYGGRGDAEQFARFGERVERHAIEQGTSWQVDPWSASMMITLSICQRDAMAAKRAAEQLERLAQTIPTMQRSALQARASYLMLRHRYAESARLWQSCIDTGTKYSAAGYYGSHGALAWTQNRMGLYAQARESAQRGVQLEPPGELDFPRLTTMVHSELAIAEAGLGKVEQAREQLHALIARHEPAAGPLTLGSLYEALLEVALIAQDLPAAHEAFTAMTRWYASTELASLAQLCVAWARRLQPASRTMELVASEDVDSMAHRSPLELAVADVPRLLGGGRMSRGERAHKALALLVSHTQCDHAHLFMFDQDEELEHLASTGGELSPAVESWVVQRMQDEVGDAHTEMLSVADDALTENDVSVEDGQHCRWLALTARTAKMQGVLGAVVFVARERTPPAVPFQIVVAVGQELQRALERRPSVTG